MWNFCEHPEHDTQSSVFSDLSYPHKCTACVEHVQMSELAADFTTDFLFLADGFEVCVLTSGFLFLQLSSHSIFFSCLIFSICFISFSF